MAKQSYRVCEYQGTSPGPYTFVVLAELSHKKMQRAIQAGVIYKCDCWDCDPDEHGPPEGLYWMNDGKTFADLEKAIQK